MPNKDSHLALPFDHIIRSKGFEIVEAVVHLLRVVNEVVQQASPEHYSSPFNGSPFMDIKDVGRCVC